jgi:hypothetical protein
VVEVAVVERERVELRQLGASQSTGSQLPALGLGLGFGGFGTLAVNAWMLSHLLLKVAER